TAVVESPIPKPLTAKVVTASVGHIPSTKRKVGFSRNMPLVKSFMKLTSLHPPLLLQCVTHCILNAITAKRSTTGHIYIYFLFFNNPLGHFSFSLIEILFRVVA